LSLLPNKINESDKENKKDLTRTRCLPLPIIIIILLNLMREGNRKGYEITMNQLWSEASRFNIELYSEKHPTKGAFSRARQKVKASVVKELMYKTVEAFDNKYGNDYLWHGLRLLAVDGTKYTLPASDELIKKFGQQKCGIDKTAHYPQATVTVLFNVRSRIAHEVSINKVDSSEREELKQVCKSLNEKDLIIADRGYPGYKIFYFLLKKKINFLIRVCESGTFKEVERFVSLDSVDEKIEITGSGKKGEPLRLRVIKAFLPSGEKRVFVTNLLDKKKYSYKELVNLYYERWEIEEHYKMNKELFKVENFHSKSENGILQEIYTQLLLSNLTRYIMNDAEERRLNKKDDEPSFKNAVCVVERYMNEVMLCRDENLMTMLYQKMLKEIKSVRYKKIPGRKYARQSFKQVSKWSIKKKP
jgi:hypothetical protein